ncbi:3-dehydroquinate synthase [Azospirillum brasilense]|uniref:3-dehydroquinate synthase n=1 Tax=Azospirillum brasilense TaxID=192 RepID=A0A0P0F0F5_AZOBR|nr:MULTISPECIES: 3-dehydroquinate synthase [Azospirillum]ALJ36173.1 3-dehydroquinate synthase [Azospirillum brasilense]MDW7552614.1 3-dehydroquinate synthase [Azospirillum brasilense]MDW7592194.1 3-dehydroquinate synthase [Azospirillum brasilense]MDW7627325.1 3-dehydroquinate synthase [Azospirillum brasilense]MDX5954986.1 3-dehydroquinate synthase [Azospirillum brasilense]
MTSPDTSPDTSTAIDTVRLDLGPRSYDILVGDRVLDGAGPRIAAITKGKAPIVVTDENVAPRHLPTLERTLRGSGIEPTQAIVLPAGEKTKDFAHFERLMDAVLGRGIERSAVLLALGGGVIGDITGFAAASALRGIDFIQVPTTLLSQVDSSVGGKTGINSPHGKNLIGAFHQPRLVIADTATLDTLPRREVLAGYAEVVKYGLIRLPGFFAWLEENGERVVAGDSDARRHAVTESCRAKAAIVGADERESGDRALLNLGHTFGHALEAATGFGSRLLHGEAVSIGMVLAFDLSVRLGLCPAADAEKARAHLARVGLPVRPTDVPGVEWDIDGLILSMAKDKKVKDGRITFVLARALGDAFTQRDVDPAVVRALLEDAVAP